MPLPRVLRTLYDLGNDKMCKPRVQRSSEHDNVNFGVFNIEEESNNTGTSPWVIIEYITFIIIIILGARLLHRLCQIGCRHLDERQRRMLSNAVSSNQRRGGYNPELEMRQMGGRPPAPHQLHHRPVQGTNQIMSNNLNLHNAQMNYNGGGSEGPHDYDAPPYEDHRLSPHQAVHPGTQPGLSGAQGLHPTHGAPPGGTY